MWTGIIVHKGDIWTMEMNEWKSSHIKNIIYVSLSIKVSLITIKRVLLPPIIPPQTKTEPPQKRTLSTTHASAKRSSRRRFINSLTSVGMAKVKLTFIGKQNQIPISTSEVQMTASPIPPCRQMTSGENLTEVRSVRTNRLNVLSRPISDSLWMNTKLPSGCNSRRLLRMCCKTI